VPSVQTCGIIIFFITGAKEGPDAFNFFLSHIEETRTDGGPAFMETWYKNNHNSNQAA